MRAGVYGGMEGIFDALAIENTDSFIYIDASMIKAHRAAAGSIKAERGTGIGRSRGGRSKRAALAVRNQCKIQNFQLHDRQMMDVLLM